MELTNVKGQVCYENVSFHYSDDETEVLSHVSIDIPAGKSVALVGPSGGGKTTICSLPVSYTHLDVYKRQESHWESFMRASATELNVCPSL